MKAQKTIKSLIALGLITALSLGIAGCTKKEETLDLAKMKERGFVTMGLDDTFAPMGFKDEKGELVGFDIDLAKEVGTRIGIEVKFQPIDWSMKETELNAGNIDLIWNGYTITDKRKEVVAFSQPYLANSQIIITLANSDISSKADLAGQTISLQKESSALEAVMAEPEVMATFDGGEPIQFDTNNEAFMDLEAGRSDAIVADEVLGRYYMKLKGEDKYKVLIDNYGNEEYGIGMRKSNQDLVDAVDAAFTEMKSDGSYDAIYAKWFAQS